MGTGLPRSPSDIHAPHRTPGCARRRVQSRCLLRRKARVESTRQSGGLHSTPAPITSPRRSPPAERLAASGADSNRSRRGRTIQRRTRLALIPCAIATAATDTRLGRIAARPAACGPPCSPADRCGSRAPRVARTWTQRRLLGVHHLRSGYHLRCTSEVDQDGTGMTLTNRRVLASQKRKKIEGVSSALYLPNLIPTKLASLPNGAPRNESAGE